MSRKRSFAEFQLSRDRPPLETPSAWQLKQLASKIGSISSSYEIRLMLPDNVEERKRHGIKEAHKKRVTFGKRTGAECLSSMLNIDIT